ncbi:SDR family oxidoreductase [Nocardia farcinica]|uniref:SDR family oxidoreductase n=1 Tax=Nocardia farcinica TaxID=37329 RepID=UPI0018934610|nr:SDR family oxidoreductase [Nocardia farcinica]MBF6292447.1 SDR family oxidoreductase [Nocardia farcinica]MBF6377409.1 SDR family oxidoreductase [Nocardia farcinica]MBF6420553.1 SDR family oxidoreductase [Nocardia farcinica]MBF6431662.1 SDR family oxidoreductase [Nocardia farcinica]MBF6502315.1 SDR family oxidoreductase [Nocardia farcinica]
MEISGKVAIVTGAGGGIGAALAHRLAAGGARVVVADIDPAGAREVAEAIGAAAVPVAGDVADEQVIATMIERAESEFGPVDLYFANAGIGGGPGLDSTDAQWTAALEVNVLAHVRAARALMPGWLARGTGYFVATASAAGLLTQIGSAPYSVTKHAAVGFAEWLAVTYGDRGIRVSCVCPMGVDTRLLHGDLVPGNAEAAALAVKAVTTAGAVLTPEEVADVVIAGMAAEQFLILPHPEVLEMYRRKGADYDRWLVGMRRFQSALLGEGLSR